MLPSTNVINVDSTLSSSFLYGKSLSFFAKYFKSANHVIQLADAENRRVIGKGIVGDRNVTISIDSKDGKYRYNIEIRPKPITKDTIILRNGKYFGMTGYTKLRIVCDDTRCGVDKQLSEFIVTGYMGSAGGPNGGPWIGYYHTQPHMLKNKWIEWKSVVDIESTRIDQSLEDVENPNDVLNQEIIRSILESLNAEIRDNW